MDIPDVRFRDGYEKLVEIRNFLITKQDLKQLQEFTRNLYEDLDYYRKMADFHAPLGLTDDARRVRRLERELEKINDLISEFPFLSVGRDGSIITKRVVTIDEVESVFNRVNSSFGIDTIPNETEEGKKLDDLIERVDELTRKTTKSQPSIAQQIMIGLLINFISSFLSATEDHTYNYYNVENNYQHVQVINYQQHVLECNNLTLRKEPSNDAQIVTQLNGLLDLTIISEEGNWVLVEYNESGNAVKGWLQRESIK
ncbi:SH3 domain-containing protein [Cytobacillus firmus]|uniref:SH3 domain-containing protein n=1 Tax=Cytobacillus firmus TaxID=1399 RepID=UPI0024C118B5|nr:SH3 domain-containing protein [Cytobacillus firmus]WHY63645.1 SH3 domain-containing protein [Cytobacillus firmus]